MKRAGVFLVVLLTLSVAACTSGPSVSAVEDYLRERVGRESDGRLQLAEFRKTNAQEANPIGIPRYSLEYEAVIDVLESCYWDRRYLGEASFRTVAPERMDIFMEAQGYQPARQGERVTVEGSFEFEKTERGWRGPGTRIF